MGHELTFTCSTAIAYRLHLALAFCKPDLFLAFVYANTWQENFHLSSFVPCPAQTTSTRARDTRPFYMALLHFIFSRPGRPVRQLNTDRAPNPVFAVTAPSPAQPAQQGEGQPQRPGQHHAAIDQ